MTATPLRSLAWPMVTALLAATLAACSTAPGPPPDAAPPLSTPTVPGATLPAQDSAALPPPLQQPASRWVAVRWSELPGFADDPLHDAWNAWLQSCERPAPPFATLCSELRPLSIASAGERRAWLIARLQPYRVEAADGSADGLLTAYFEPVLDAARTSGNGYVWPIHQLPAGQAARKPWYTRQQIDTLPEAQAALQGRAIAWLRDPLDVLLLHIQGSGRLRISEPDGTLSVVRVAWAGSNEQPYRSPGRWLLDQGAARDASWPAIRAWLAANPGRTRQLLWSNPRYVFFREEPLGAPDAGPRGAQGVALTPGRSIAVDRQSIPYGTPVWLASSGPQLQLQRLVLAQDTGSAILGAVRADFFMGSGAEAGEIAGRLKQGLRLWALWPK